MCPAESEPIRSFIAVDLQAPVREALQAPLLELSRLKADVRWVRPQGMHVTLKFLGGVEAPRLEQVHTTLAAVISGQPSFRLRVRGLGAFPSLRRPRVLWVGLEGLELVELATRVETAMTRLGFAAEKRPFAGHITVGRVSSRRGWPRVEEVISAHLTDDFGESAVDAVIIYRSTLRPDGAVYTPLWTIPLSLNKEGVRYDTRR